jgi:acyl-coenzyme A synthetase/AMP-(fatty) acid ligase
MTAQDTLLAVTTLSFDIAGLELFVPLTVGGRVVLVSRTAAADGKQLSQHLADTAATVMQATPTTWRILLEAGWQGSDHLRILCGGEALPSALATQLLARGAALWNLYGPTETTIWSTAYHIPPQPDVISIGRPIANTRVYVLDGYGQPIPVGVPGELYIGGDGVARGYLNQPELTAERFLPDHYSAEPGARLYASGDLARLRSDGNIEFLGRLDHQVKLRGFRVELGEIESVLAQHPAVGSTVVLAREDVPGEKRLIAYVVPQQESALTGSQLRSFLQVRLPDYMLPSAFVILEALPLTANGKVDRQALPVPEQSDVAQKAISVAPRTSAEEMLARIWAEVLRVERVGVQEDFFALGGYSLQMTQVISRVRQVFQVELPMRSFFETPTVAGLLVTITRRQIEQVAKEELDRRLDRVEKLSDRSDSNPA